MAQLIYQSRKILADPLCVGKVFAKNPSQWVPELTVPPVCVPCITPVGFFCCPNCFSVVFPDSGTQGLCGSPNHSFNWTSGGTITMQPDYPIGGFGSQYYCYFGGQLDVTVTTGVGGYPMRAILAVGLGIFELRFDWLGLAGASGAIYLGTYDDATVFCTPGQTFTGTATTASLNATSCNGAEVSTWPSTIDFACLAFPCDGGG